MLRSREVQTFPAFVFCLCSDCTYQSSFLLQKNLYHFTSFGVSSKHGSKAH